VVRIKIDIKNRTRNFLQTCLFRKYLNYCEESRTEVRPSAMQVALIQETNEVAKGYDALLDIMRLCGKLTITSCFILLENPSAVKYVLLMPCIMLLYGFWCHRALLTATALPGDALTELVAIAGEACHKYRLIADYTQRPQINENFSQKAEELRRAEVPAASIKMACFFFPKWLSAISIGIYLALNAWKTLLPASDPSHVSVGEFMATLTVFQSVCTDFTDLFKQVLEISLVTDPLKTLSVYLNLVTDVRARKRVNDMCHGLQQESRIHSVAAISGNARTTCLEDTIPIRLESLSFGYRERFIFKNVSISVPQGKLVAIVGAHGSGKATLLRILGHTIFPGERSGHVFIPTHLRILHVSQEPMLLNFTLWENLVFGCPGIHDDTRIKNILHMLGMNTVLSMLEEQSKYHPESGRNLHSIENSGSKFDDDDDQDTVLSLDSEVDEDTLLWQRRPMYSEKAKIHLARAFIMNPEVMIMHRPLHHFSAASQGVILNAIREHVDGLGLFMPQSSRHHLRPRTVFFTPESIQQAKMADVIWKVDSHSKQVAEINPSVLSDETL